MCGKFACVHLATKHDTNQHPYHTSTKKCVHNCPKIQKCITHAFPTAPLYTNSVSLKRWRWKVLVLFLFYCFHLQYVSQFLDCYLFFIERGGSFQAVLESLVWIQSPSQALVHGAWERDQYGFNCVRGDGGFCCGCVYTNLLALLNHITSFRIG